MKTLLLSVMFAGCVLGGAVFSFLVTTTAWGIQIEPRAFQCTDIGGWPIANYLTDMDTHKGAGDTISPAGRGSSLKSCGLFT
jgi:hypothetical protein